VPGAPPAREAAHDYDERQPASNENAFPFAMPGAERPPRPGGAGPGARRHWQGGRPQSGPMWSGTGERDGNREGNRDGNRDGNRPAGNGYRGPGQGPRGAGKGKRGPGQPGRGAAPGARPAPGERAGPHNRPPGKGNRPPGKGKRPHGTGGRPQGARGNADPSRPVVDRRVQQVKPPREPKMPLIKRLRRPGRTLLTSPGEAGPVAPAVRSDDES
jgi:hypothetical protein